jgi:hypothetical protein
MTINDTISEDSKENRKIIGRSSRYKFNFFIKRII